MCALVRNDMQKTGTRQRVQGGGTRGKVRRRWQFCLVQRPCLCGHAACFCMSLRGAQRRGNPFSLQYSITESSTLGEYEKYYEFALGSTSLHTQAPGKSLHVIARSAATWQSASCRNTWQASSTWGQTRRSCKFALSAAICFVLPQGKRIATPVCALVRNDMQKTGTRSECKAVLPSKPAGGCGFCHWANVLANADTQQISACHCEERSDVAIRSPCSTASQKAVL